MNDEIGVKILQKLDGIEEHLKEHDKKFEEHNRKFAEHDRKFDMIFAKLEEHDRKFEEVEERILIGFEEKYGDKINAIFDIALMQKEQFEKVKDISVDKVEKLDMKVYELDNRVSNLEQQKSIV